MTDHPITPPPELVEQRWNKPQVGGDFAQEFAAFFARWGADQELEACCEWLHSKGSPNAPHLRTARRPKPPSLKDQALEILGYPKDFWSQEEVDTIHRALEQLDEH